MNSRQLLKELKRRLLLKGIAPGYVDRLIQELSEHQEDIKAGEFPDERDARLADTLAAQRLGDVDELADTICSRMRERTFIGRHPWVSYVILPIVLFAAGLVLVGLSLSGAEWIVAKITGANYDDNAPLWAYPALLVVSYLMKYGLTALVALFMCRVAMRTFCGIRWAAIGMAAFAFLSMFIWINVLPPDEVFPKRVQFQLALGLPVDPVSHIPSVSGVGCYLREEGMSLRGLWHYVPLLMLSWYVWQTRQRSRISDGVCE